MRIQFIALCLLVLCAGFVFVSRPVLAHFCDDTYTTLQDRENCWWRYWNGLSTLADRQGSDLLRDTYSDASAQPTATPVPVARSSSYRSSSSSDASAQPTATPVPVVRSSSYRSSSDDDDDDDDYYRSGSDDDDDDDDDDYYRSGSDDDDD